jgi:serine/threonine-protein kinase HipA
MNVDRCPATLKKGFTTYSPTALKKVFYSKKVNHVLPYLPPEKDEQVQELFMENRVRISISGVQKKLSLFLTRNKLTLTDATQHGLYILKPIPDDVKHAAQVPANEHVTMQLAEQVFGIQTAPNALIFFQDGQPAYITKRFDRTLEGKKFAAEDFSSLARKTSQTDGDDYKYEASVEVLFRLLKEYVGAYRIESQRLFRLILFNYVVSNGDAHLKNFSLLETISGDYLLSPAYDLICSRIHVNDPDLALKHGLFADDFTTESFAANGFYAYDDFLNLGLRAGLPEAVVKEEILLFLSTKQKVIDLVERSFLEEDTKLQYLNFYEAKLTRMNYSFKKLIRS